MYGRGVGQGGGRTYPLELVLVSFGPLHVVVLSILAAHRAGHRERGVPPHEAASAEPDTDVLRDWRRGEDVEVASGARRSRWGSLGRRVGGGE